MSERRRILGLVLAGGRATRMGGADKALIDIGGQPLLSHAIMRLSPQCAGVVINANGDAARFAAYGRLVVPDGIREFAGPLAGILAGLDFAASEYDDIVSLPVDTPFAPPDLVARLVAMRATSQAEIAVASSGGRTHHAVALWPVSLAQDIRDALTTGAERSVMRFCAGYRVATADWPVAPYDPFFNVNTPDDLARAEAIAGMSRAGG